jgi:hypothetical protein
LRELAAELVVLQRALVHDVVVELAARGVLHDEEDLVAPVECLKEPDDVAVVDVLEDMDLAAQPLSVLHVLDKRLVDDLDRNLRQVRGAARGRTLSPVRESTPTRTLLNVPSPTTGPNS